MIDKEKVRQGVYQCLLDSSEDEYETQCWDCPYYNEGISLKECKTQLRKDFSELLKEHRPGETFTVIDTKTGKEADEYNIALYEDWAKDLCYCDMEGWAIENDGTLLLVDECGRFAYADRERFKVVWDA